MWKTVSEKPENQQEVLGCYYDTECDRVFYNLVTYCEQGTHMYTKIPRELSGSGRLLSLVIDKKNEVRAEKDGFYYLEWGEDGDTVHREDTSITHWMPLPEPVQYTEVDNTKPITTLITKDRYDELLLAERALTILARRFNNITCNYCPLDGECATACECNVTDRLFSWALEKARVQG